MKLILTIHCIIMLNYWIHTLPGGHWHKKEPTRSIHVPPLKQAEPVQSSIFSEQYSPVQPFTQIQENEPNVFVHVAPFCKKNKTGIKYFPIKQWYWKIFQ